MAEWAARRTSHSLLLLRGVFTVRERKTELLIANVHATVYTSLGSALEKRHRIETQLENQTQCSSVKPFLQVHSSSSIKVNVFQ